MPLTMRNLSYAGLLLTLPLFAATAVIAQQSGRAAYAGIVVSALSDAQAVSMGAPHPAVIITNIDPKGPAFAAGARAGDILEAIDNQPIATPDEVAARVATHTAGDTITLLLLRENAVTGKLTESSVPLRLAARSGAVARRAQPQPAPQPPAANDDGPGYTYSQGQMQPAAPETRPNTPNNSAAPNHRGSAVLGGAALPVSAQQSGPCSAMLPAGWTISAGDHGQTLDITGDNGATHAGWGILGINTAQQRFYGGLYGPPDLSALTMAGMLTHGQAQYTSSETIGGYYTAHNFTSGNQTGTVLYHAYPAPAYSGGTYIISEYFAWTDRSTAQRLPIAQAVMTSIRCQSSIRPSEQYHVKANPNGVVNRGSSSTSGEESDRFKDYNSQLNTQYAHDSLGRNYLLDGNSWNDNGPDGPGYYANVGGQKEKLVNGIE